MWKWMNHLLPVTQLWDREVWSFRSLAFFRSCSFLPFLFCTYVLVGSFDVLRRGTAASWFPRRGYVRPHHLHTWIRRNFSFALKAPSKIRLFKRKSSKTHGKIAPDAASYTISRCNLTSWTRFESKVVEGACLSSKCIVCVKVERQCMQYYIFIYRTIEINDVVRWI